MSELKVYKFLGQDEVWPDANLCSDYYLKSEVDKVIAELEMKLAVAQLVSRLNQPEALFSDLETMCRLRHEIDVVARRERHQKYKRCLAMAWWCMTSSRYEEGLCAFKYKDWYWKWFKRWLKLAKKFNKRLVIGVDVAIGTDKTVVRNYKEAK